MYVRIRMKHIIFDIPFSDRTLANQFCRGFNDYFGSNQEFSQNISVGQERGLRFAHIIDLYCRKFGERHPDYVRITEEKENIESLFPDFSTDP